MLETDFILMMTVGCLQATERANEKLIAGFGEQYVVQQIKAPGKVSIGGNLPGQLPLPWETWTERLREQNILGVNVQYIPSERPGLPAHIAAAFAGSGPFALEISTADSSGTWYLRSEQSRRSEMAADQFALFLDSQEEKTALWRRVHELINESNALNHRSLIPEGKTAGFLNTAEGAALFDFLGDTLVSEIQVECALLNTRLSFEPAWDIFFVPASMDARYSRPAAATGKEPVYFYLLREVIAGDLIRIVAAQPFAAEIRPALALMLEQNPVPELKGFTDPDVILTSGTVIQMQTLGNMVCQAIISGCQNRDCLPVIPSSLEAVFGPGETDQFRARARGHAEQFRRLAPTEITWRYYQFDLLPGFRASIPLPGTGITDRLFRERLDGIARFAAKHQVPYFSGIFRLAIFILSPVVMSAPFSSEAIMLLTKENGFEEFSASLTRSLFPAAQMQAIGWPVEKCYALLSVSLTSVFGGMGSWNDQSFDGDQEEYTKVSADFFLAHQQYFAAQLSNSRPTLGI